MERNRLPDKAYDDALKTIVKRDFYPELNRNQSTESSVSSYSLQSFCNSYVGSDSAKFSSSIEKDRLLLKSAAPNYKPEQSPVHETANPWPYQPFNSLFYTPCIKNECNKTPLSIEYSHKRRPYISYDQTRFPSGHPSRTTGTSYHPFTTESSTTESESEFEGRSQYRADMIKSFESSPTVIFKERLQKRKLQDSLTKQGRELLKELMEKEGQ